MPFQIKIAQTLNSKFRAKVSYQTALKKSKGDTDVVWLVVLETNLNQSKNSKRYLVEEAPWRTKVSKYFSMDARSDRVKSKLTLFIN